MPSATSSSQSTDPFQARVNVSLADARRLVDSWLPPSSETFVASRYEEMSEDERELLKARPARLGLGAPLLDDSAGLMTANDALRKVVLGKRAAFIHRTLKSSAAVAKVGKAGEPTKVNSDDEEEGRARLGRNSKRRKCDAPISDSASTVSDRTSSEKDVAMKKSKKSKNTANHSRGQ